MAPLLWVKVFGEHTRERIGEQEMTDVEYTTNRLWPRTPLKTVTAPWWKTFLAKRFGKRRIHYDNRWVLEAYEWRGVLYVTDHRPRVEIVKL